MKSKKIGKQTIVFNNKPIMRGCYSIVGGKEGEGNFKEFFHHVLRDDLLAEKSYEMAERDILELCAVSAVDEARLQVKDIDVMLTGDLLNQIITSSFTARKIARPFLGLYGACSTMAESLIVGSTLVDGGYANNVLCGTASHFSSAERQYRFPLELGNQRPPTSQWTVTGAGCTVLSNKGKGNVITKATIGKVVDYGVKDVNNMGASMAPSAMELLIAHFEDTKTTPEDYDLVVTGDLGKLGSEILRDLMERRGYPLGKNYSDCGQMMFSNEQKTFQGASGAGCSAAILNSYINTQLQKGVFKKVLFTATGALLSTVSSQQGESIPGICHGVVIERAQEEE